MCYSYKESIKKLNYFAARTVYGCEQRVLLLNNNLSLCSQPDIMVRRVKATLGRYSLENFERRMCLLLLAMKQQLGLPFTLQEER